MHLLSLIRTAVRSTNKGTIPTMPNDDITQPVDLAPYRVEVAPAIDPKLRMRLIGLGARLSLMMEATGKTPETVAKEVGVSTDIIDRVRAGAEADVGIRTLVAICANLGCPLQIGVLLPASAPATAPSPLANN